MISSVAASEQFGFSAGRARTLIGYELKIALQNVQAHPEVASVGLTEQAAREAGYEVKTSKFPYSALGKAGIIRAREGFFKLVAEERYGEILGVHIIGEHATDLISEGCAVLGLESTAADLAHIIHPHPTISEGMLEAAHGLLGGAIHS